MDKKLLILILVSLIFSTGVYYIFIQKPSLPDYFGNFFKKTGPGFGLLTQKKKNVSLKVPILMYHYVENVTDERDTLRQSMATRPNFLEGQLGYLKNNGYTAITLTDLYWALSGAAKIPEKSVVLTFDDGYRDFYTDAYPLLKKYGIKAINYIIVNHIGRSGNLTEEMIKEMLASGLVEIGCHTLDHDYLPKDSLEKARREIVDCKKQLEDRFGVKINHFAYPGGYYNGDVVKMVREAGFQTGAATVPGVIHSLNDIYTLKRLHTGNLSPEVFAKHLQGPKAE